MKDIFALLIILSGCNSIKRPYVLDLTPEDPIQEVSMKYNDNPHDNFFKVQLPKDKDVDLIQNNKFYLVFESSNPQFVVSILKPGEKAKHKANIIIDLISAKGNIMMVMSDSYFNGHLNFFKESRELYFVVMNKVKEGPFDYKVKLFVQQQAELDAGKVYTTRVDYKISDFQVLLTYDGTLYPDLYKLRFQVDKVRGKEQFNLGANLTDPKGARYVLNQIYKKTVGGLINKSRFFICQEKNCSYTLQIQTENVKVMNIVSNLGSELEELSYNHYGSYYERTYQKDSIVFFKIPFIQEVDKLDVSITLIPVTGNTGLYVNADTKPLELENYDWSETGALSKRLTIKWEELEIMKVTKSDLYVAVSAQQPGEFLIKLDAHQPGLRGKLEHGVIEGGFVKAEEINNYLYFFEVFKTQEIKFDLKMNVITGNANIFIKQCDDLKTCMFGTDDLQGENVISVTNTHNSKLISHSFDCEHQKKYKSSLCYFSIAIVGIQNNGTHYDLTINEKQLHKLMIPGYPIKIDLNPQEKAYFKFSYPSKTHNDSQLRLHIESVWGNFNVYIDKKAEFPSSENSSVKYNFLSPKAGLYNSFKDIAIQDQTLKDFRTEGMYFITVEAITGCSLSLKFYEQSNTGVTLNTLISGDEQRGTLSKQNDIIYYSIKASLEENQASSVTVNLTPLKGKFLLISSRYGKVPTRTDNDHKSTNNSLSISYDDYNLNEEHIIGVMLNQAEDINGTDYQFYLSFNYENKPLKLKPGLISSHVVQKSNTYLIEVTPEMSEILILKGISDGHNLSLCASFTGLENETNEKNCVKEANEQIVSIYFNQQEIKENCETVNGSKCFIFLNLSGGSGQKFSLGFTYNDHPFKLIDQTIIQGPQILKGNHKLNFIMHIEKNKPVLIYFNSKGLALEIYSRIVKGDEFNDSLVIPFPTPEKHDEENVLKNGHHTNVYYSEKKVSEFGDSPEILVSIRPSSPSKNSSSNEIYNGKYSFTLHTGTDSKEILRTSSHGELMMEEEYYYYHFYNNGTSKSFKIDVNSNNSCMIEVLLSKNLQSRPPFTDAYLFKKTGLGSVSFTVTKENLLENSIRSENVLKGHFTIAIKSACTAILDIYWNNKRDLDYFQLTPGSPTNIATQGTKKLYFSVFVKDSDEPDTLKTKGIIRFYVKSDVKGNFFILKSLSGDLDAPSEENHSWKTSLSHRGGISLLEILPSDEDYCVDCTYIGYFDSIEDGNVKILVDVEHDNLPIFLTPNFTFPELLRPKTKRLFKIYNADTNEFSLSFSILSGSLSLYVGADEKVDKKNNVISRNLSQKKENYVYIKVKPSDFNKKKGSNYYLFVENDSDVTCSFNLSVIQNSLKMPIDTGIKKVVRLGYQESAEYFKEFKQGERVFEIQLEITHVASQDKIKEVQASLNKMLEVYLNKEESGKYKLEKIELTNSGFIYYVEVKLDSQDQGFYSFQIYNPVETEIQMTVQLIEGGYKLVNMDQKSVEKADQEGQIFEIYGHKDEFMFVDMRVCFGEAEISFFESDFDNVNKNKFSELKTIKDQNSFVKYLKLSHERVFVQIKSKNKSPSYFSLTAFNEKHLEKNPYSSISQISEGRIFFNTSTFQISFNPIQIDSTYRKDFIHKVTYKVFITNDIHVMKYTKNCGVQFLKSVFPQQNVYQYEKVFIFKELSELTKKKVTITLTDLAGSHKYYGQVVAHIELFSSDPTLVKPIKSGTSYYDEFIVVTPRFNFPIKTLLAITIVLGFLFGLFIIVKNYIFGDINKFDQFSKLSDLNSIEESVLGIDTIGILEQEYYESKKVVEDDKTVETENPHEFELTDNDRTVPLDIESQ